MFAAITVALIYLVGGRVGWVLLAGAGLVVAVELLQPLSGRGAEWIDVHFGLAGCAMGLVGWRAWQHRGAPNPARYYRRAALLLAVLALWPLLVLWPAVADARRSYHEFPVLSDFSGRWETERWTTENAGLEIVQLGTAGEARVGRIRLDGDLQVPQGLILFPMVRDWAGYRRLVCEFAFDGEPLTLLISIRDGRKVIPPRKRFDRKETYQPGRHRVTIDLEQLAAGVEFSPLDLSQVQSFHFVALDVEEDRAVDLLRVALE